MSTRTPTTSRIYRVVGMNCGHCVAAVQREVGAIDGVTDVAVDLPTGDVVVTSTHPIADDLMTAAIDEAGYELAS
jgi:copper ion binding protein